MIETAKSQALPEAPEGLDPTVVPTGGQQKEGNNLFENLFEKVREVATTLHSARPSPARQCGCTAVCVLLTPSGIYCANAGDSRAVLCRKGRAVVLSRDHK